MTDATLLPRGRGAVMAGRVEPPDSLDFFPTPPWGTRALFAHVLPAIGVRTHDVLSVWEPCCGMGHMSDTIAEFTGGMPVIATDIFDYGFGMHKTVDFLDRTLTPTVYGADWLIFNPPFAPALDFVKRALDEARVGVAALLRTQWLEGEKRYLELFRDRPPTVFAPFVERLPMHRGRWEPEGGTMTSYAWFVWHRPSTPRAPFWIPPCRVELTRRDDVARFAWRRIPDPKAPPAPATLFEGAPA